MAGRDEKMVFAAMMAELSDDSSDDDVPASRRGVKTALPAVTSSVAEPKRGQPSSSSSYGTNGAKATSASSVSAGAKRTSEEEEIENFGAQTATQQSSLAASNLAEQLNTQKRWLQRICKLGDPPMQCYVERDRSGFGRLAPTYRCYLEPSGKSDGSKSSGAAAGKFLMAAKKKTGKQTSYYLVSLEPEPDDRGSDTVLGKQVEAFQDSSHRINEPTIKSNSFRLILYIIVPIPHREDKGQYCGITVSYHGFWSCSRQDGGAIDVTQGVWGRAV
jgi:Tub family